MIPLAIITLIGEALRLTNNIIEAKPLEQRQAEAIIAWELVKPILLPLLPEETRKKIEELKIGQ